MDAFTATIDVGGTLALNVSIVVPNFNQAQFLDATLRSLVGNSDHEIEIIVMDGGSKDGSVEVIKKYESDLAFWRSSPDAGQTHAIAEGFSKATGELLGWINADDVLAPGAIARLLQTAQKVGGCDGVFYGGYQVINESGEVEEVFPATPVIPWIARRIGPIICQPGTFWGRAAYEKVHGVDASLQYCMDLDLWMRFITARVPFHVVSGIQAQYRRHKLQKGHSDSWGEISNREERELIARYGMAQKGSISRFLTKNVLRLYRILSGEYFSTVMYRASKRGRIRYYSTERSD